MNRISTSGAHNALVQYMLKNESALNSAQVQESTSTKSTTYAGLASTGLDGNVKLLVNLESEVSYSSTLIANADAAVTKIDAIASDITSISDIATSLKTAISEAMSTDETSRSTYQEEASGWLSDVASILNDTYGGQYIFGGSDTTHAPVSVDSATYGALTSSSDADTSYYSGNDTLASVRVSSSQTISYGVTADDPSIEKLMRALNMISNTTPLDDDTLTSALDLVNTASSGLSDIGQTLSDTSSRIQTASSHLSDINSFASDQSSDIKSVDLAEVSTTVSTLQTSLEATMQAIAASQKMSLVNYL
ncbi:flagellin [Nitrospirillum iridis]|uniref:Flagellar hook-associated protein 3 FlgL n=1 Tax=Nitrospirillum iridis TaxID=765888 RepID=A0A7X0AWS7_9PROT|nr:flagellin [Nitrospirillum iridis]MBB6251553.1 flagellar hook-associated protein 3 FlgL [Nitrospirillum iridis]